MKPAILKFIKRPAVRYPLLILLGVLIGVSVYGINASVMLRNEVPMPFGFGASVIVSGSMEPALSTGDLIIIREEEHYQQGDIVVFQSGTMPVVHRIVNIDGELVITKGDANNIPDDPIPISSVKGKVIADIPAVGYVIWKIKSPLGIAGMILLAILLIEGSYHVGSRNKYTERKQLEAEIQKLRAELAKEELETATETAVDDKKSEEGEMNDE